MASKQPRPPAPQTPPNNNAKSLDRWDDEGGAPSGGQYRHKRAMPPEPKNPAAVAAGRLGGAKGGPARAKKLTPRQRSMAARKAAKARRDR